MSSPLDQLGPGFVDTLVSLSAQAGVDPLGAAAVMLYESGLQPAIMNSIGAVGINQFIPDNYGQFAPLSVSQYRALSAAQQLPYVFKFWRGVLQSFGRGQKFFMGRDLYWLNILPGTFRPNVPDNYQIPFTTQQYAANKNLDHGGKGYITPNDFSIAIAAGANSHPALWKALQQAIPASGGNWNFNLPNLNAISNNLNTFVFVGTVGVLVGIAAFINWPGPAYALPTSQPRRRYRRAA